MYLLSNESCWFRDDELECRSSLCSPWGLEPAHSEVLLADALGVCEAVELPRSVGEDVEDASEYALLLDGPRVNGVGRGGKTSMSRAGPYDDSGWQIWV